MNSPAGLWSRRVPPFILMASGFAGLGYQIIWTQQSALWLGHESAAVLAVIAAFFGGLALGALALGRQVERSAEPARWYAGCELLIAVWSLVITLALAPVSGQLLALIGAQPSALWQWSMTFGATFLMLLPATAAMGVTLPAMERVVARAAPTPQVISRLYASNTAGAVLGVTVMALFLLPRWGLTATSLLCTGLNLLCAGLTLMTWRKPVPACATDPKAAATTAPGSSLLWRLAATGFLGIGYEVLVVRVLSQVTEDTVYTFALLLAVYLLGTATGAAVYRRHRKTAAEPRQQTDALLMQLALACLLSTAGLWWADTVKAAVLQALGPGVLPALTAEAVLAVLAFAWPTAVMGALFCQLSERASAAGIGFYKAIGVNTLGAALAPVFCGVLAAPLLGPQYALLLLCAGYGVLVSRWPWRLLTFRIAAPLLLVLALLPPLAFVDVPPGGSVVNYEDGMLAAVSVVQDAGGALTLRINNRQQEGSNVTMRVDGRQAWLPLLLHPDPKHALFLGLGTGMTSTAAVLVPPLQVDVVELLPEVIRASTLFTAPLLQGVDNPRLHQMVADARRYVRSSRQQYDVIIADNFHPARSGSGALYTVEHFAAVKARLAADGLFCQWLPLHQLDIATLQSIVRSFTAVYPQAYAVLASNSLQTPVIGLVAHADNSAFDAAAIATRTAHRQWPAALQGLGLEDEWAVLGSVMAGPAALQAFAKNAPLNTDDHPVVAYAAPRVTYQPDSRPLDRLQVLLKQWQVSAHEVIGDANDGGTQVRLEAYWQARSQFIAAGSEVRPTADLTAMLAQVREPLLQVLRVSADFRPAYDPLLAMAQALAAQQPTDARALLSELARLAPQRTEASQLLRGTDGT